MKKSIFLFVLLIIYSVIIKAQSWAIDAVYAESCDCNAPCPCIFGLDPTHRECLGNNVVSIISGHYDSTKVDGLKMFLTFNMGNWAKVYIDKAATKAQAEALMKLLKQPGTIEYFLNAKILSVDKVPITIEQTDSTYTFFVPNSYAKIKYMQGKDGKPINVLNLPDNFATNNKLCKSVNLNHKGDNKAFKFSGTHGLLSHFTASSEK